MTAVIILPRHIGTLSRFLAQPADITTMNPTVSFLIATHNRGQVLVDCLRQLDNCGLAQSQYEILVVDNASTDGTPELVAAKLPHVRLIRLAHNRGPVAKNYALAQATGTFAVFLDDDAYPLSGSIPQMLRHFQSDPQLAAAVFDVTLPDGSHECSAYPDVFIGAGTGFRRDLITRLGGLPQDFFMQAEEYDLSFRILAAGGKIKRFSDLPLLHLKTPSARIATRTTRLDVRNNMYLLAKYIPAPLCFHLADDWLTRYFYMAQSRDAGGIQNSEFRIQNSHKSAYLRGSAEGLARWSVKRNGGRHLLAPAVIERFFKFSAIESRLARAQSRLNLTRILLADFGKNMYPYYVAANKLNLEIVAIADDYLAAPHRAYRGVPLLPWSAAANLPFDAVVVSNLSPVHAARRTESLRRICPRHVINLFGPTAPSFIRA